MASKLKPKRSGIAGAGNFDCYMSMVERRRSSASTPEVHGQRRVRSRKAAKSNAIRFGY